MEGGRGKETGGGEAKFVQLPADHQPGQDGAGRVVLVRERGKPEHRNAGGA